jgi:hypothetical protein
MQFQGTPMHVTIGDGRLTVAVGVEGVTRPITVGAGDEVRRLGAGDSITFELEQRVPA